MAGELVNMKMKKGKDGEWSIEYECNGFQGSSCEAVAHIMQKAGEVKNYQVTGDGDRQIPIPVPNELVES